MLKSSKIIEVKIIHIIGILLQQFVYLTSEKPVRLHEVQ